MLSRKIPAAERKAMMDTERELRELMLKIYDQPNVAQFSKMDDQWFIAAPTGAIAPYSYQWATTSKGGSLVYVEALVKTQFGKDFFLFRSHKGTMLETSLLFHRASQKYHAMKAAQKAAQADTGAPA